MSQGTDVERELDELPPVTTKGAVLGLYVLECVKVLEGGFSKFTDSEGNPKPQVKWVWRVVEVISSTAEDWEALLGQEWFKWTTKTMSKRGTMYAFVKALLGRDIGLGPDGKPERITPAMLIGKRAEVYISEQKGDDDKLQVEWTATVHRPSQQRIPGTNTAQGESAAERKRRLEAELAAMSEPEPELAAVGTTKQDSDPFD